MTTAGDTIYGGTAGAATRLAIGTAGQIKVVNAGATAPAWASPATLPFLGTYLKSGLYYHTLQPQSGTATATPTAGVLYVAPFFVPSAVTLIRIGAEVTTGGSAGAVVRLGIWSDTGSGYPGALVLDAGTIDGTSATVQEITISQADPWTLLGWWCDSSGNVDVPLCLWSTNPVDRNSNHSVWRTEHNCLFGDWHHRQFLSYSRSVPKHCRQYNSRLANLRQDPMSFYLPYQFSSTPIATGNANPFDIDPEQTVPIATGNANPFGIDPDQTVAFNADDTVLTVALLLETGYPVLLETGYPVLLEGAAVGTDPFGIDPEWTSLITVGLTSAD